jgi:hypothetical protein
MIVLGFDIADSDLPLRVAFPLMMSNALRWLSHRVALADDTLRAGEALLLEPTEEVAVVALGSPGLASAEGKPTQTARTVRELFVPMRNGFYRRTNNAGSERWIAVNTFDPVESDLLQGAAPSAEPKTAFAPLRGFVPRGGWPPWHYLAFAAMALSAFEWWLFHRRRTE